MTNKLSILIVGFFCTISLQAHAESINLVEKQTSPWSVRAGASGLLFNIREHLEVSYRLPDNHFEILAYSTTALPSFASSAFQIGARYYINPNDKNFQYFAMARGGVYIFDGRNELINSDDSVDKTGSFQYSPEITIGVGADWQWTENWGLTGGIYSGTPYTFLPELALKYTF